MAQLSQIHKNDVNVPKIRQDAFESGPSNVSFSLLGCNDLYEDDEDEDTSSPRKKTTIEEQWEKNQGFELTSVEQETYEKYFYGTEHWNYFTNDEDLGPVILSIKQETLNGRDQFR